MNRDYINDRNRKATDSKRGAAEESPSNSRGRTDRTASHTEPKSRNRSWFKRHKIFSAIMLMVLLTGIIAGGIFIYTINNSGAVLINRNDNKPAPGQSVAPGQSAAPGEQQPGYSFPKDIVNILILGTDGNAARIKEGMNARTDCVMLASINTTTKKVSLISIPRDTYVSIYDEDNKFVSKNRVNAAFSFGGGFKKNGISYAMNTVSQFFGGNVPIDHYVLFDMDLVKSLIDAVGGVNVDVDISLDYHTIHLRPGVMKLSGIEALTYARDRHNTTGGDFGRVGHQQQVMVALLKELQNKGNIIKSIPELYTSLAKNVVTNPELGLLQITALAWIAKDVNVSSVKQYTLHGDCLTINGASIVITDQEEKQTILKEAFGIDYRIRDDETYSFLKGEITKKLNAGQGIIKTAQNLLNNNKDFYTADEARDLRSAIADWQAASKKNDGDGMAEAQQDVQTEYDILKHMIDVRKAEPKDTPQPEDTPEPTDEPVQTDDPVVTDSPEPTESLTPTEDPEPTETPADTENTVPPSDDATATASNE